MELREKDGGDELGVEVELGAPQKNREVRIFGVSSTMSGRDQSHLQGKEAKIKPKRNEVELNYDAQPSRLEGAQGHWAVSILSTTGLARIILIREAKKFKSVNPRRLHWQVCDDRP